MGIRHLYQEDTRSHIESESLVIEQSYPSASENDTSTADGNNIKFIIDEIKINEAKKKRDNNNDNGSTTTMKALVENGSTGLEKQNSKDIALQTRQSQFIKDLRYKIKHLIGREFPLKIEAITQLLVNEKQKLALIIQSTSLLDNTSESFIMFPQNLKFPNSIKMDSARNSECLERKLLTVDGNLVELINKVNSHVQSLVQEIGSLKLWVYMVLSNESTSMQMNCRVDELMQEITMTEKETSTMQEDILAYYVKRNNVISEIFRYPYLTQNDQILEAINYKQYIDLQIMLSVIRNKYSILQNVILTHWRANVLQEESQN